MFKNGWNLGAINVPGLQGFQVFYCYIGDTTDNYSYLFVEGTFEIESFTNTEESSVKSNIELRQLQITS